VEPANGQVHDIRSRSVLQQDLRTPAAGWAAHAFLTAKPLVRFGAWGVDDEVWLSRFREVRAWVTGRIPPPPCCAVRGVAGGLTRPLCVPASTTVRQVYSAHFQRALEEQVPERETGGAPEADAEHSAAAQAGAAAAGGSLAEHAAAGEPARIPRVLHQIWLGSPLPPRFAVLRARWRALHPRWRPVLWTDTEIDAEHARVAPRPSRPSPPPPSAARTARCSARAAPAAADATTATLLQPPPRA